MQINNPPYLVQISKNNIPYELVAHMKDGKVLYMQERLMSIMQKYGINIPPGQRKGYENKSIIYLQNTENSLFERAFRTIYYPLHMPKDEYQWFHEMPRVEENKLAVKASHKDVNS